MKLNELYSFSESYEWLSGLYKVSFIKKLPNGKYRVYSRKGKNLGTYATRDQAKKRLKQVEYFKYLDKIEKKASKLIDLSKIEAFSYSSIMRQINKQAGKNACYEFAKVYKKYFDKFLLSNKKNHEKMALKIALKKFNHTYDIKLNKDLVKNAAERNLGDPLLVGRYLANIIKFSLNRISPEKRPKSINRLKFKIHKLNEMQISGKQMPASSSMGQALTFVKGLLFGQDPIYIRQVINNTVRNL